MHGASPKVPAPLDVKLTVPVGVLGLVVSVSVTVAGHVVDRFPRRLRLSSGPTTLTKRNPVASGGSL